MSKRIVPRKLFQIRDQIAEAYNNDKTLREIASIHGVSTGTVRSTLIEAGVSLRSRGRRNGQVSRTPTPGPIEVV